MMRSYLFVMIGVYLAQLSKKPTNLFLVNHIVNC